MKVIRKEPVVMSAIQWTGDNPEEVLDFLGANNFTVTVAKSRLLIESMSRKYRHLVRLNRWIIKDYQKLTVLHTRDLLADFSCVGVSDEELLWQQIEDSNRLRQEFFKNAYDMLSNEEI